MYIHIKITQYHYLVRIFLQMDCDETLHVVWVCPGEGVGVAEIQTGVASVTVHHPYHAQHQRVMLKNLLVIQRD